MRFIVSILFVLIVFHQASWAQSLQDTIQIEEVVAHADYKKYQAGVKVETISGTKLESAQVGGLEHLLMRYTPIYVKTNAGGLSTIHIRGTAADHTSIMFGGININSLTLGHSNLSNITSFLFDRIDIQYGSSSAINGSGAIGGAIYLGEHINWVDGAKAKLGYTIGSFGARMYGARVAVGNGKWELESKIVNNQSKNNFPFLNTIGFDNREGTWETQNGAAINNTNFIQHFNYQFSPRKYFKSALWIENSWHEVQPSMLENSGSNDVVTELQNNNLRFWSEYVNHENIINWNIGAGYVQDKQIYNNIPSQLIQTNRFIASIIATQKVNTKIGYKIGTQYRMLTPNVYSYSDTVNLNEQNLALFAVGFYQINKKLRSTINLRQQLVTNFHIPFAPALGLEYKIWNNETDILKSTFNFSKSYRIPTFNDRFWPTSLNPLGTPDLKAEDGFSTEIGVQHKHITESFSSNVKLTMFYMDINDWIEWRNLNGPIPVNLEKVNSKGVELHADFELHTGEFISKFNTNYTFNPSLKIEAGKPTQQVIYAPKHMVNAFYELRWNSYSCIIDGSFIGNRYYEYINKISQLRRALDPYFISNISFHYDGLKFRQHNLQLMLAVNNRYNTSYQNELYYAMPGRNFSASIRMNLYTNNK